ncbi:MAG: NADP-dependent oxidoreductase [Alphaproteobacteria bacterium]
MTNRNNRQWILARRPQGDDFESALEFRETGDAPVPAEGQVLVRPHYLSMDAGTRMWMSPREDAYQPPLPVGAPMSGMMIGEVVETRRPDFAVGDKLRCFGQWADYSAVDESAALFEKLPVEDDIPLPAYLAMGGPNGWTAYVGIANVGEAKPGETVLISAAAGATGSLAGQVAKNLGCRVIGLTSRNEKCAWLTDTAGFDAAINYRTQDVGEELRRLAPDGVDVFFDNVGGDILDTVMGHLAMYARIAICGLVAHYADDGKRPGPMNFDQVLMKRATIKGFFSPDWFSECEVIEKTLKQWYRAGKLTYNLEVVDGLENTLAAYHRLFEGSNIGKVMVKV